MRVMTPSNRNTDIEITCVFDGTEKPKKPMNSDGLVSLDASYMQILDPSW